MKRKSIKSILRSKMRDWLASIEDEAVRKTVEENAFVTGGCIASMLVGEPINDFDVYFRTREATKAVAEYYVEKFKLNPPPRFASGGECEIRVDTQKDDRIRIICKSVGVASESGDTGYEYFEQDPNADGDKAAGYIEAATDIAKADEAVGKPKYRPIFLSTNAITLSHRIQIVTRFYGSPDEIHANYDFAHCTCYWQSWDGWLELRPAALEALLAKELVYIGSKYPLCSVMRLRKFIPRGYHVTAGQCLKICWQIAQLDLTNPEVLEEQLTGVDTAYFAEIITKLKEADMSKVDGAYLFQLIDKVF